MSEMTREHLEESDPIRQFVLGNFEVYDPNVHGTNKVIFTAKQFYDMFVNDTNRRDISLIKFGKRITELGVLKIQGNVVKYVLANK